MVKAKDITHTFPDECVDLIRLFDGVNSLKEFKKRLESQSDIVLKISKQDYLGNGFEFFVEMFLKSFPSDNRIGISGNDYTVVPSEDDNGCDGYAKNLDGLKCAVQIKYKSNKTAPLSRTDDNLGSMIEEALHEGITYSSEDKTPRHFIITTGSGMKQYTKEKKFRNKVRCINYSTLDNILYKTPMFWGNCRSVVRELEEVNSNPVFTEVV